MKNTLFRGFFSDELTEKGYVKFDNGFECYQMTDRRVGEHTKKNHAEWVKMYEEIKEAYKKRNDRAFNKEMSWITIPYALDKSLIADGYRYDKATNSFYKNNLN